jgi:protein involved in polysaccharide export with SLBB domain
MRYVSYRTVKKVLAFGVFFLAGTGQIHPANAQTITVTVTGAVASPGPRSLPSTAHLNDALLLAAPTLDADLSSVQITHGGPGNALPTDTVNYALFLDSQQAAGNPPLHDGDSIVLPHKAGVSISVNLRGEVVHPGRIQLPSKSTLIDAIGQAGGLTSDANLSDIAIQHSGSAVQNPIDYTAALKNPTDASLDPILLDGDTLIVKAADKPNVYTITGAVLHPGEYSLPATPTDLADALGQAGGPADHAKLKQALIVRTGADGKIIKLTVNASDPVVAKSTPVLAGDNIIIPQGSIPQHIDPLQAIGLAVSVYAMSRH